MGASVRLRGKGQLRGMLWHRPWEMVPWGCGACQGLQELVCCYRNHRLHPGARLWGTPTP